MKVAADATRIVGVRDSTVFQLMTVCLLPLRRDRFELYCEPPEGALEPPDGSAGRWARWAHTATVRWHHMVAAARLNTSTGRITRWRDGVVRRLAETITAQRTLWALRHESHATLLFPSTLGPDAARRAVDRSLEGARRHHAFWATLDLLMFLVSAVVAPIPGPNVLAYYLAFRVVGHFQSWRGARHTQSGVAWTLQPDDNLAELASLVDVPRELRASRVADIAARLNLHRLSAHFERVAV